MIFSFSFKRLLISSLCFTLLLASSQLFSQKVNFKKNFFPFETFENGKTYVYQAIIDKDTSLEYHYFKYYPKEKKLTQQINTSKGTHTITVELSIDKKGIKINKVSTVLLENNDTIVNIANGNYFAHWKMSVNDTLTYSYLTDIEPKIKTTCKTIINTEENSFTYNGKECIFLNVFSVSKGDNVSYHETVNEYLADGIGLVYYQSKSKYIIDNEISESSYEIKFMEIKEGKFTN